jgi:hypothetical protein
MKCFSPTSNPCEVVLMALWSFIVSDCGRSAAIAAAPRAKPVPRLRAMADNKRLIGFLLG